MGATILSFTSEMVLDEFTRAMIDGKLHTFCEHHETPDAQDQVALTYAFRRASVILYEQRRSRVDPKKWIRMKKIARVDFDESSRAWTLWAYDRNDGPQRYPDLPESIDFDAILGEIRRDPNSVIWG